MSTVLQSFIVTQNTPYHSPEKGDNFKILLKGQLPSRYEPDEQNNLYENFKNSSLKNFPLEILTIKKDFGENNLAYIEGYVKGYFTITLLLNMETTSFSKNVESLLKIDGIPTQQIELLKTETTQIVGIAKIPEM